MDGRSTMNVDDFVKDANGEAARFLVAEPRPGYGLSSNTLLGALGNR